MCIKLYEYHQHHHHCHRLHHHTFTQSFHQAMTKKSTVHFSYGFFFERWFFWWAYTLHRQATLKKWTHYEHIIDKSKSAHQYMMFESVARLNFKECIWYAYAYVSKAFEIATFQDWHKTENLKKRKSLNSERYLED